MSLISKEYKASIVTDQSKNDINNEFDDSFFDIFDVYMQQQPLVQLDENLLPNEDTCWNFPSPISLQSQEHKEILVKKNDSQHQLLHRMSASGSVDALLESKPINAKSDYLLPNIKIPSCESSDSSPQVLYSTPLCFSSSGQVLTPLMKTKSSTAQFQSPSRNLTDEYIKRKLCKVPNCNRNIRSRGFCKSHGGGKPCQISSCQKEAQNGDFCIGHGGGKCCKFVGGCSNAAQSQGLCKAHGGGARCKYPSCERSSQGGGFCRSHGGGKRCKEPGCTKGAQRGNKCARHGGCRSCTVENCNRTDRGGGYCELHRKDKLCNSSGCKRLRKNMGLCTPHIREWRSRQQLQNIQQPPVISS